MLQLTRLHCLNVPNQSSTFPRFYTFLSFCLIRKKFQSFWSDNRKNFSVFGLTTGKISEFLVGQQEKFQSLWFVKRKKISEFLVCQQEIIHQLIINYY